MSRRLARGDTQLIAVPSLSGPPLAELPHTQVVFRAVENRVAVVMADVAYNSAIVDAYGHVLQLVITPSGAADVLVADVPLHDTRPLYSSLGDWLGWMSLAGLVGFMIYMPLSLKGSTVRRVGEERRML